MERQIQTDFGLSDVSVQYLDKLKGGSLQHYRLQHHIGLKRYELSEHRGNVMSVISDKPLVAEVNSSVEILGYEADILQFGEYYPFGMQMPNLGMSQGDYRFGFQGQEQDNEVKGDGNNGNFIIKDITLINDKPIDTSFIKYQGTKKPTDTIRTHLNLK